MSVTLLKTIADLQISLVAAVSVGDTTATLSTDEDSEGTTLPSGKYGFTVDGDTSAKEYIVCDLVGTALTNIQSITVQGVASTGFSKYHRYGATVTITDWAVFSRILNNLTGATGFDSGANLGYDGAPAGLTGNQFATVNYVLSVVSGGAVSYETQTLTNQTAGENLTAGDAVYFKESDQKWWKTDADTTSTFYNVDLGIAGTTASANASVSIVVDGIYTTSGLTAGSKYYLATTPGAITATAPSAPSYSVLFGVALSTTKLYITPQNTKGAEQGSTGIPSSNNKFLTQDGTSDGLNDQTQTTQDASTAVGTADATTLRNKVAQSFIPTENLIDGVILNKQANTGTFTGTVTITIQADTAGAPSGVALATKTITNAFWLAYSTGAFYVYFTSQIALTPGNTYWIVVQTSTADTANCINIGTNSAGGYANGTLRYNNTTDGWVTVTGVDLYFVTLQGGAGKIPVGNATTALIPPRMRSLLYKVGSVALNNGAVTTVSHGLGKVPTMVRAWYALGEPSNGAYSMGVYDVLNNAYVENGFYYNEGTSGSNGPTTNSVVQLGARALGVTISQIDENIVTFSAGTGTSTIAYEITA